MSDDKVRENRLRRKAGRQGLSLHKSRRRDPHAWDYGTYMLVDPRTNGVVAGNDNGLAYTLSLNDVEEFLYQKGTP